MDLTSKKCVPCEGGTKPLAKDKIEEYLPALDPQWEVIDNLKLKRRFKFKN